MVREVGPWMQTHTLFPPSPVWSQLGATSSPCPPRVQARQISSAVCELLPVPGHTVKRSMGTRRHLNEVHWHLLKSCGKQTLADQCSKSITLESPR